MCIQKVHINSSEAKAWFISFLNKIASKWYVASQFQINQLKKYPRNSSVWQQQSWPPKKLNGKGLPKVDGIMLMHVNILLTKFQWDSLSPMDIPIFTNGFVITYLKRILAAYKYIRYKLYVSYKS